MVILTEKHLKVCELLFEEDDLFDYRFGLQVLHQLGLLFPQPLLEDFGVDMLFFPLNSFDFTQETGAHLQLTEMPELHLKQVGEELIVLPAIGHFFRCNACNHQDREDRSY